MAPEGAGLPTTPLPAAVEAALGAPVGPVAVGVLLSTTGPMVPVGIAPAEGETPEGSMMIPLIGWLRVSLVGEGGDKTEVPGLERIAVRTVSIPTKMGTEDPLAGGVAVGRTGLTVGAGGVLSKDPDAGPEDGRTITGGTPPVEPGTPDSFDV